MMSNKYIASAAGIALWLVFSSAPSFAQTKQIVKFMEYPGSTISFTGWVMQDEGFCAKQGIACESVYLSNGPLAMSAAAAGSVDLTLAGIDVTLQSVAHGNDLQIVGALLENSAYQLVARSDIPRPNRAAGYPDNMRDLEGLKIGVSARGSAVELFMRALLAGAGISPSSVTYISVGGASTQFAALKAKQVDAAMGFDPVSELCVATHVCDMVLDLSTGEGPADIRAMNGGYEVWAARREFVEKNGPAIDAFMRAEAQAIAWMKDPRNFSKVLAILKKHLKIGAVVPNPEPTYEAIAKHNSRRFSAKFDPRAIDGANDFLLKNKVIDKPVNAATLVYKSALNPGNSGGN